MPDGFAPTTWTGGGRRFSVRLMALAAAIPVLTFGVSLAGVIDRELAGPTLAALAGGGAVALGLAVLLAVAMAHNVTRRQLAERRLMVLEARAAAERRLSDVASHFPGIIYRRVMDPTGRVTYPYVSSGFDLPLVAGASGEASLFAERLFHPDDRAGWLAAVADSARSLRPFHCELRLAGGERWVRTAASPRRTADGSVVWDGVLFDITDLKAAELALKTSLDEKEAMLREIHHRVRNNLQVVASLIQIEALHITDAEARLRLGDVSRRIAALGHLHEELYGSTDFTSVDCGRHLHRLCLNLAEPRGLVLDTAMEPLRCDLDTAIPLGLIAHELLHAAAERAARQDEAAGIAVTLRREGDSVLLVVRGGNEAAGLGDRILLALAAQLDGRLSHQADYALLRLPGGRFHD